MTASAPVQRLGAFTRESPYLRSKPRAPARPAEPQMSDTRMVDGQKQVYFLGFGWIEDSGETNHSKYAADMYENGKKIGVMGGGIFVDGDGDINKMVGIMGE